MEPGGVKDGLGNVEAYRGSTGFFAADGCGSGRGGGRGFFWGTRVGAGEFRGAGRCERGERNGGHDARDPGAAECGGDFGG